MCVCVCVCMYINKKRIESYLIITTSIYERINIILGIKMYKFSILCAWIGHATGYFCTRFYIFLVVNNDYLYNNIFYCIDFLYFIVGKKIGEKNEPRPKIFFFKSRQPILKIVAGQQRF